MEANWNKPAHQNYSYVNMIKAIHTQPLTSLPHITCCVNLCLKLISERLTTLFIHVVKKKTFIIVNQ